MPMVRRCVISLVALFIVGLRASAQAQVQPQRVRIPSRTYVGFNPIGLPADVANFELETGVVQGITLGGVASYIDATDDRRFTTFDFKARYYPGEIILRDFSIGASLGWTRFSNKPDTVRQTLTAPTVGLIADYNWLFGREQHFLVGTGIGVKRVLASHEDRDRVDIDKAIFTVRFILGYAF